MQQIGRVHILEALQALVNNVLLVNVLEDVGSDDGVKIRVHEIEYQVDIPVVLSSDYVLKADDVLVAIELLEENNLAERALCVSGVLESVKVLFKGYDFFCSLVNSLPYDTVSTLAEFLDDLVFLEHMRFNLFRHF